MKFIIRRVKNSLIPYAFFQKPHIVSVSHISFKRSYLISSCDHSKILIETGNMIIFKKNLHCFNPIIPLNNEMEYNFENYERQNNTLEVKCTGRKYASINASTMLAHFANIESLIISNTRLTSVPEGLNKLMKLKKLKFTHNRHAVDFCVLSELQNLAYLNVSNNRFLNFINISYLVNLVTLDLSYNKLVKLPPEIGRLVNLEHLNLEGNALVSIPIEIENLSVLSTLSLRINDLSLFPSSILKLKSLLNLDLSFNRINSLPIEIKLLYKLESLTIAENHTLTDLPEEIGYLRNLKTLNLENNKLIYLPVGIINLINLENLNLKHNQLLSLPVGIGSLINLQILDLKYNHITFLKKEIGCLTKLKILLTDGNVLNSFPNVLGNLIYLESLDLSNNIIKTLPGDIGNLTNLKNLRLYNCGLDHLPCDIGKLNKLSDLEASRNSILSIPDVMRNLFNLTNLNLSENEFKIFPEAVVYLPNIKKLNLSCNKIESLPNCIWNLTTLLDLNLNKNKLKELPSNIGLVYNLKILDLGCNDLKLLPEELENLSRLHTIDLEKNQLESISSKLFTLVNLKILLASNNKITYLSRKIGNLMKLEVLDLSYNYLNYLPSTLSKLKNKLQNLNLIGNPIQLSGNSERYGAEEILQNFSNCALISRIEVSENFVPISIQSVYSKIKKQPVHWNVDKLKTIKTSPIPKHLLSGDAFLELWDTELAPLIYSDENSEICRKYIEHLYFADIEYKLWRMNLNFTDIAKDLLEAIVKNLIENNDDIEKINSNINALSVAFQFCPDRQIAELRFCYYLLIGKTDPYHSFKSFVYDFIATQKESIFCYIVTPDISPQNVHVLNYWKHTLSEELGFDFQFISGLGTMEQDEFQGESGNVLDSFYDTFTPLLIILRLKSEINENKPILCLALQYIFESQERLGFDEKSLFYCDSNEHTVFNATSITEKFIFNYLCDTGILCFLNGPNR